MSKTEKLAQHLEKLQINNMYKNDFYWTWDKTDDELDAIFTAVSYTHLDVYKRQPTEMAM